MNLRSYLHAIRKRWLLVIAATVVGTGLGVAALLYKTPIYQSSVTFYISTSAGTDTSAYTGDQLAQLRATSYAELIKSDRSAQEVVDRTGIDLSAAEVAGRISGAVTLNTTLLTASVVDDDKARALLIAQGLADTFPDLVQQLGDSGTDGTSVALEPVNGPSVANTPISPNRTLYIGFGFIAGLLLGLFAAAVRDRFDTAVRSTDGLEGVTEAPLLAAVPQDSTARTSPLLWGSRAVSQRAEAYRRLRTNLQFADVDNPVRTLVVTSSVANEGKSSTSANLALSFADSGKKVVVIEADLRRPRLADYFEIDRTVGLTDVLAGRAELALALQPWGDTGLSVLPSGSIPPNPSELLGSQNMRGVLDALRDTFDIVILDTPPVLPVTDAAVAAASPGVDGVVFVIAYGKTKHAQVASSIESLQTVGGRVLGIVINMSPVKRKAAYGAYGEYSAYENGAGLSEVIDVNTDLGTPAPPARPRDDTPVRSGATVSEGSEGST